MRDNIVLVTIDSLRADHCSFMGYDDRTTPTLDRLARDGVVFENAIAPGPITPESLPVIFTGKPMATQQPSRGDRLNSTRERIRQHMRMWETIPERLSQLGYTTGAFTPNPWTSRYFGFDRGFDHFQDFMAADLSSSLWERMIGGYESRVFSATRLVLSWLQRENVFKPWTHFYDDIITWVESASEPYFLWVFLLDVHFPYLAGRSHRSQASWREYEANLRLYLESQRTPYSSRVHNQLVTAYDDAIRHTDAFFERLSADIGGEATMVITSDHGEAFGDHGTYTHQNQLYEENIHVPLIVANGQGSSIDQPVSLRAVPEIVTGLGRDGAVPDVARPVVTAWTNDGETAAVRGHRIKYIRNADAEELYDLAVDEHTPLSNASVADLCREIAVTEEYKGAEIRHITDAVTELDGPV